MTKKNLAFASAFIGMSLFAACSGGGSNDSGDGAVTAEEFQAYTEDSDAGTVLVDARTSDSYAGWALGDDVNGGPEGWINTDYIIIDPAWYRTDDTTPVYAWNDTKAPKVALLDKDTTLPIIKDEGDWFIVSLRGAAGWVLKNDADRVDTTAEENN